MGEERGEVGGNKKQEHALMDGEERVGVQWPIIETPSWRSTTAETASDRHGHNGCRT